MCALGRESWVQIFDKCFRRTLATFEECPIVGTSFTVHYTFFKGTDSLIGFYELMRVSLAGLRYFLRYFWGNLSLFFWPY